jgi:branched-chain amino acid transport system substrate-binding protein
LLHIIDDRSAYGQGLADEFDKAAKALGVEIVKREFTSTSATDFMAILTGIKGAQPDLIFFGGVDAQAAPMVKQMQKLGVKAPLLSGDGTQTGNFIKLAADAAEGQYASAAGAPKEQLPGYASFAEKLKNKYNAEVVIYSPYSYDAVKVMAVAMKAADSADPKQYLPKLAATNYQGATGHITFDAQGNRQRSAVTIYQVKQGKWEVIGVVGGENTAQADAPAAGKAASAQ